jgi:hypothetical protein
MISASRGQRSTQRDGVQETLAQIITDAAHTIHLQQQQQQQQQQQDQQQQPSAGR